MTDGVKEAIEEYVSEEVDIIETRQDPLLDHSMAVRTEHHECFIMNKTSEGWEVYEEFALEKGETLQNLESSEESVVRSIFL